MLIQSLYNTLHVIMISSQSKSFFILKLSSGGMCVCVYVLYVMHWTK